MSNTARLNARHRAAVRFKWYGMISVGIAALLLVLLMASIIVPGLRGFMRTEVLVAVSKEEATSLHAIQLGLQKEFPGVEKREDRRQLFTLIAANAAQQAAPEGEKIWAPASSRVARYLNGDINMKLPEYARGMTDKQVEWTKKLNEEGSLRQRFNWRFFTGGDSRMPEKAGFGAAIIGSLLLVAVCMATAFPVGVLAAVYLEEFARKGWVRDVIEVTINNLAAVPSIVFGLLGLAVFLLFFGLPRSSPLVGGLTLALMILPIIIISTRVSLQSVPPSIREAALALGASRLQVIFHHVLPLALPGIMTGTILSVARAIGETAPLIMIGMVAFIADVPEAFVDPSTVMPVQIYIWASSPERGFIDKTASGILVLLVILLALNAVAIFLRKKYEVRW